MEVSESNKHSEQGGRAVKNLIKAVQSYAVSIIVGLFRFPKRLIASIARFLKWIINSVRPHATPPKSSLVKSGERLSEAVLPHIAPAKASLVKSGKWLSEAVRPHVAPAQASLVKSGKRLSEAVRPNVAPAKASLVKSGERLSEAVQPHVAPAKANLVKFSKWSIKSIIPVAIGAALTALFSTAIFSGLFATIAFSILKLFGYSTIAIIMFSILGFVL